MVASNELVIAARRPSAESEECHNAEVALELGARYDGIDNPLTLYSFIRRAGMDNARQVNIRTAKQEVFVQRTGCLPEQAGTDVVTRVIAVDCPQEPSDRCKTCILTFDGGDVALQALTRRFDTDVFKS